MFKWCMLSAMAVASVSAASNFTSEFEEVKFLLKDLVRRAEEGPADLAQEIASSELAAIVKPIYGDAAVHNTLDDADAVTFPTVVAHGMGDSCFNAGMKQITTTVGTYTKQYSVCVPTGDNVLSDTINGFLMNMDKSVDVFAKKIQADPKLANGFNAVGFSQGNSLIRGYIHKYNNPPVQTFLSVHGTVSGVEGFPQCNPAGGLLSSVCQVVAKVCGGLAYNSLVQGILFQANYFRDPLKTNATDYLTHSQIAAWNNEAKVTGEYKTNFGKVKKYAMVKAMGDTMVFPNEGEHWGSFADGQYKTVSAMKDTRWYKEDLFGLKTADEAGKVFFEQTTGNHLQFSITQLQGWVAKYFV